MSNTMLLMIVFAVSPKVTAVPFTVACEFPEYLAAGTRAGVTWTLDCGGALEKSDLSQINEGIFLLKFRAGPFTLCWLVIP